MLDLFTTRFRYLGTGFDGLVDSYSQSYHSLVVLQGHRNLRTMYTYSQVEDTYFTVYVPLMQAMRSSLVTLGDA